ncbi:MAG: DNA primase [Planctomycetes bacterium]|nr:DNA primase [Planctomycetota bacterium]
MLDTDAKEQVRQAVDIVDFIGGYIQLRRQGRNFVGLCPWHDDSRPSLQVNPQRQSWKCWVCDVGGDVFSFAMKVEGLEFREALEMLADRAGIQLRSIASQAGSGTVDNASDKRSLLSLMTWAEDQYHHCLLTAPEAEPGRQYLAERGINEESIRRFHLGFAPDRWDWLLERARGSEWTPAILERAGLLRRRDLGDGFYDWFRGRVMFSIRDARSRPVAFGGRVLPQLAGDRVAKYINSPETPLFSKSRELYGLDLARDHFKRSGGAIVMEGYTDCLMAHQYGIENAVAVLGTALGDQHVQLLRRYDVDSILLVLDGDEAGRRRTNEILDSLLALFGKNEVDLRILTLPEGLDPCDCIATQGSHAFRDLLTQAVDALEHKFRSVTKGLDTITDTHRASQAAEQMLATLAQLRPAAAAPSSKMLLREEQMLARVSRYFHLPEERLRNRLAALRREARGRRQSARVVDSDVPNAPQEDAELSAWDRELIELVLSDSAYCRRVQALIDPAFLESDIARRIYETICRLVNEAGEIDFSRLLAEFDDVETKNLLVKLDESSTAKAGADRERRLLDLIEGPQRRCQEAERRIDLAAAQQDTNDAEQLLAKFCEQSRLKHLSEYERRKK